MSRLRTSTRIARIAYQSSSPGAARATAEKEAAATTARSVSWSRRRSALRWRLVMSGEPDPGLRHLHACQALQDVEQDEHAIAGGDEALEDGDQAAPRPVGDAHGRAGGQRAGLDDAVRLLAAAEEVDHPVVEARRLAAEDDQVDDPRRADDLVEARARGAHEDVAGEERPHLRADRRPGPSPQQREIGLQPLLHQADPRHRLAVAVRRDDAPGVRLGVWFDRHGSARRARRLSAGTGGASLAAGAGATGASTAGAALAGAGGSPSG